MDSLLPFVVRYKIHSNKEEWPCCDICVIILCFIYVHNRGVPNILRQAAEAEYSAVWPNILPKPNRGSLFAE